MFTKVAENRFLDDILATNPGTIKPEKNEKKFLGLCTCLNCLKMDPKQLKKKYTVAHSIPDVTPRNKKKSSICPGYYMRGLPVLKKYKKNTFLLFQALFFGRKNDGAIFVFFRGIFNFFRFKIDIETRLFPNRF